MTKCGYTNENFGGLQKEDIAFLSIAILSLIIDNSWKPISTRPIIMFNYVK